MLSRSVTLFAFAAILSILLGCQPRVAVSIAGPSGAPLREAVVLRDDAAGSDKIVQIDIRGLIADARSAGLLGPGPNPVDEVLARLELASRDAAVKALILRVSSPGGTVTGSDILYAELRRFRDRTGRPIVASLGEVAASGGYYVALAADRIVAQPTSITGSIGVIVPTINASDGLKMIGVHARSVVSGPNKNLASPLEPAREEHFRVLQGIVDEFHERFRGLVRERRPALRPDAFADATDGRVFTGRHAAEIGLADAVGGLRDAFDAAKSLAGLRAATLVKYVEEGSDPPRSPYAAAPDPALISLRLNLAPAGVSDSAGIYYLWLPEGP